MSIIPQRTRVVTIQDADLAEFHELPELSRRTPDRPWQVEFVTVPMDELYCPYPNPGDAHAPPAGFMGGIGWAHNQAWGKRIVDLAAAIAAAVQNGVADRSNVALDRVLAFRAGGLPLIQSRAQLLAFIELNGFWCVREGMHRAVAMAMLGVQEIEAANFSTLRQAAA